MTQSKGALTRERILNAAVDSLVVGGIDFMNLDDILLTTKTSKSQLFYHFPGGKRQLRTEATKRQVARLLNADEQPQLDSWEAWEGWVDGIIRLHESQLADDACEVAALAGRALDSDLGDRAIIGGAINEWHDSLSAGFHQLIANGSMRADTPIDQLASLVLAALEGAAVMDKATRSQRFLEPALRAAFDYVRTFSAE
jgi:TetR/AcrR family transcriptional regulator, transcriptional repressor for nem operon